MVVEATQQKRTTQIESDSRAKTATAQYWSFKRLQVARHSYVDATTHTQPLDVIAFIQKNRFGPQHRIRRREQHKKHASLPNSRLQTSLRTGTKEKLSMRGEREELQGAPAQTGMEQSWFEASNIHRCRHKEESVSLKETWPM